MVFRGRWLRQGNIRLEVLIPQADGNCHRDRLYVSSTQLTWFVHFHAPSLFCRITFIVERTRSYSYGDVVQVGRGVGRRRGPGTSSFLPPAACSVYAAAIPSYVIFVFQK